MYTYTYTYMYKYMVEVSCKYHRYVLFVLSAQHVYKILIVSLTCTYYTRASDRWELLVVTLCGGPATSSEADLILTDASI